jgi:cyclopropane fatty-acyl-phospholipid synthase-like methyltransferase
MAAQPQRMSSGVEIFEAHYAGVPGAGWEIGRPQPAFVELAAAGAFRGRVLDVGCGTGEHVLLAAAHRLDATGVDAAPSAIAIAREKAAQRGLTARFLQWDVLALPELREQFDTVLDCGLFHCFQDADRPALVASLSAVVRPGGRYFLMCFSDRQPGTWGPRRVSRADVERSFAPGFRLESIVSIAMDVAFEPGTAQAWLATLVRI